MKNTVSFFRLIHRFTLGTLLLLIATIPLIININMVTAFVTLPAFLIFIFTLSIIVENKLNALTLNKAPVKRKGRCAIINCLHNNCMS